MRNILVIGKSAIEIIWEDREISGLVENLFSPWRGEMENAEHSIRIERQLTDFQVTVPGVLSTRVGADLLVATLEQVITYLACDILRDYPQIHAAVVDFQGKGAIISGPRGSGKTTLALAALSSGWTALTDEVALLDEDCRTVRGFPRPFRAREGTRTLQPPVIPADCPRSAASDGITHVFVSAPGLNYYRPETRAEFLLFPVRRPGETEFWELSEREALLRLFPRGFNYNTRPDGCLSVLLALIRHTRAMEIRYSDHWHALFTMREMISEIP